MKEYFILYGAPRATGCSLSLYPRLPIWEVLLPQCREWCGHILSLVNCVIVHNIETNVRGMSKSFYHATDINIYIYIYINTSTQTQSHTHTHTYTHTHTHTHIYIYIYIYIYGAIRIYFAGEYYCTLRLVRWLYMLDLRLHIKSSDETGSTIIFPGEINL